jgi:hypothetical protein
MANNRAFLVCPVCKEWYFLGKCYGDEWAWPWSDVSWDQFLRDHHWCGDAKGLDTGSHLRLMYEHSTDKDHEIDYQTYRNGADG